MQSIFDFHDYREYLQFRIKELKQEDRRFTYRFIASELGLKSAGQVTQMVKGDTAITARVLGLLVGVLQLRGKDREYFELLVHYGQATALDKKREILYKLTQFSGESAVKLTTDQYLFYQKWYYAAIRDLLSIYSFTGDYKELSRLVDPAISLQEARDAIALLERLNLIYKNDEGVYTLQSAILSIDNKEVNSLSLSGYADQMIERAHYSLNNHPRENRSISWAGFSASHETFLLIQDEIRAFRSRVMAIVEKDTNPTNVFHLNIHCFPLSKDINQEK